MKYILCSACLLLSGCEALQDAIPDVEFTEMEVSDLSFQDIETEFVFQVNNPNPVGFTLDRFEYDLQLADASLLTGSDARGLVLEPLGAAEVRLPTRLVWANVYDTINAVTGEDDVAFALSGTLGFDTDWGPVDLPYRAAGSFPALREPAIRLTNLRVSSLDVPRGTATVTLEFVTANDHGSPIRLEGMQHTLSLEGNEVASGLISDLGEIPGADERLLEAPLSIDLVSAGVSVINILTNGSDVDLGLQGTVDVDTPWGVHPWTFEESAKVPISR